MLECVGVWVCRCFSVEWIGEKVSSLACIRCQRAIRYERAAVVESSELRLSHGWIHRRNRGAKWGRKFALEAGGQGQSVQLWTLSSDNLTDNWYDLWNYRNSLTRQIITLDKYTIGKYSSR